MGEFIYRPKYGLDDVIKDQAELQARYNQYLDFVADLKDKYGSSFVRVTISKTEAGAELVKLNTKLR